MRGGDERDGRSRGGTRFLIPIGRGGARLGSGGVLRFLRCGGVCVLGWGGSGSG